MKKILILCLFVLIGMASFSQVKVPRSGSGNTVVDSRWAGGLNMFVPQYADTILATANRGIDSCGAIIFVTSTNSLWWRMCSPKHWVQLQSNAAGCEGLQSGGIITWDSLFVFDCTAANYCIGGQTYNSAQGVVTLANSDPSNPRFDIIGVDTTGTLFHITGTPSPSPVVPISQVDFQSQLILAIVRIDAGSSSAGGQVSQLIYNEDVGQPTEWVTSFLGTAPPDPNNTQNPYDLLKAIKFPAFSQILTASSVHTTPTPVNISSTYNTLTLHVYINSPLGSKANINVSFYVGSQLVTSPLPLSAAFGFDKNLIKQYQTVSIPLSAFTYFDPFTGTIDGMRFTPSGSNADSFYIDYIRLVGGTGGLSGSNHLVNIYRVPGTDTVNQTTAGGQTRLAFVPRLYTVLVDAPLHAVNTNDTTVTLSADTSVLATQYYVNTHSGSTPTWQQTLVTGSSMDQDNDIDGGGFYINLANFNEIDFNTVDGSGVNMGSFITSNNHRSSLNTAAGEALMQANVDGTDSISGVQVKAGQVLIYPFRGNLNIDSLNSGASTDSVLVWNPSTHNVGKKAPVTPGSGTVTNVAALTLGTTGTDLTSSVANSTTTPVITLNVPTASASNRGALSAADWITFNGKGSGTVTSVSGTTNRITSTGGNTPVIDISATFEGLLGKVANPLSQFASTTSAQLAGVVSDETGTGSLVFANSPAFTTPNIGSATGSISGNAGTATILATGRTISTTGDVTYTSGSFNGSANVTGTATVTKINGTSLAGLSTGILKNTTTTGVPSIAVSGTDIKTINGSSILGSGNLVVTGSAPTGTANAIAFYDPSTALSAGTANATLDASGNLGIFGSQTVNLIHPADADYTVLITDNSLVLDNWTGSHNIDLSGFAPNPGMTLHIALSNTFTATFTGATVINTDGTTLTSITGKGIDIYFAGSNWQVFSNIPTGQNTIVDDQNLTAQTTTQTVNSYTTANDATIHSYTVGGYVNITAVSANVVTITISFKDENGNTKTITMSGVSTVVFSPINITQIRVGANQTITVTATVTGIGSVTYDVGGTIIFLK